MLAELWDASEAISIWVELVSDRRRDIAERLERGESLSFNIASAAGQQEISRQELAVWDASARAWIEGAKSVMLKQDTQLRLILKNISLSVNQSKDVYRSVTDAWKLALETMEKLISSMPQEAHQGAAILGLAAWHLYPEINVFGTRNVEVKMEDPLVAEGGILTLGCSPSGLTSSAGVCWSLCLNHLKFYGSPVLKQRSLQDDPSKISFQNFCHAIVGVILSKWKVLDRDVTKDLKVMIEISDILATSVPYFAGPLRLMQTSANDCLNDESAHRYLTYGRKRPHFIDTPSAQGRLKPFFGLLEPAILLHCLNDSKDRVALLSSLIRGMDLENRAVAVYDVETSLGVVINPGNNPILNKHQSRVMGRRKRTRYSERQSNFIFQVEGAQLKVGDESSKLQFWYGDITSASIFIDCSGTTLLPPPPSITVNDLLQCLQVGSISGCRLSAVIEISNPVVETLSHVSYAAKIFGWLPALRVRIQALESPLVEQYWTESYGYSKEQKDKKLGQQSWTINQGPKRNLRNALQVVASLACGYDMKLQDIPDNVTGISVGDSIIVPSRVIHPKRKPFVNVANPLVAIARSMECRRIPSVASAHTHTWKFRSSGFCHILCAQRANDCSA
jgi:hypothetical protein